ncbi:hypothetical protein LSTR_LSTR002143 [Laodelphax striatellus]|uniref:C2H2-type domain-containing protein n=1 Tax=Laodelphax striatellus TaxID=195883 RepID=A0A482XRA3_LAOST|nr:hypothetical protein LSTR_LSTR002143 [Laodelphax striatellus]
MEKVRRISSGGETDHHERENGREHTGSTLNETTNLATVVRRCYTKRKSFIKVQTQVDELSKECANQSSVEGSGDCLEVGPNSNDKLSVEGEGNNACAVIGPNINNHSSVEGEGNGALVIDSKSNDHLSDEEVDDPCSVIEPENLSVTCSKENEQECRILNDDIPEPVDVQASIKRRFATSTASTDSKKRKFFCNVEDCSSSFLHRATYLRHMNLHETSSSRCKICFKIFAKSAELLKHQSQIHNGQSHKLYPCSHCDKSFSREESRDRHLKRVKKHETFICVVCNKIFHDQFDLNLHTRNTHQENRPFSCKECGKEFKRETHVIAHMKVHFPSVNNVCNVCNKEFATPFFLNRHSKVHSARKHKCDVCCAGFTYKRTLGKHMREQHPKMQALLKSQKNNKKRGRIYQYKL